MVLLHLPCTVYSVLRHTHTHTHTHWQCYKNIHSKSQTLWRGSIKQNGRGDRQRERSMRGGGVLNLFSFRQPILYCYMSKNGINDEAIPASGRCFETKTNYSILQPAVSRTDCYQPHIKADFVKQCISTIGSVVWSNIIADTFTLSYNHVPLRDTMCFSENVE